MYSLRTSQFEPGGASARTGRETWMLYDVAGAPTPRVSSFQVAKSLKPLTPQRAIVCFEKVTSHLAVRPWLLPLRLRGSAILDSVCCAIEMSARYLCSPFGSRNTVVGRCTRGAHGVSHKQFAVSLRPSFTRVHLSANYHWLTREYTGCITTICQIWELVV